VDNELNRTERFPALTWVRSHSRTMSRCPYPYSSRPFFASRPWLAATLMGVGLVLFSAALISLSTHALLYPLDLAADAYFSAAAKAMPGDVLAIWTYFGNLASIAPEVVVVYLCYRFLRKKCDDRFTLILASYGVGMLFFFLLALGIHRARPSLPGLLKALPFPSFPSGHMIQTITLLAPILYIYLPRTHPRARQVFILLLAVGYAALVGYDRLVVDAHYLTDVLAGTGIGLFWSTATLSLFERYHLARRAERHAARVETT
jgi:undecaprenyl-diphosphatase